MSKELITAISEIQEDEAIRLVQDALDRGEDPSRIMDDCQEAMKIVGDRYQNCEYFLPELMMSGQTLEKISKIVQPKMAAGIAKGGRKRARVVIGTVHGDVHDIGKNIVSFMLDVSGFEVHDLGVDVSDEKFVQAVKEFEPQVVALSGFLTVAYDSMKSIVEALDKAGLRKSVKIMIGGGTIGEKVREYATADAYGMDAAAAIGLASKWIPER